MNSASVLVVTPTLGESEFLDQTMASVAAQPLEILHVLSAPASRVAALADRYPHARAIPDAGKAGGIYGALNAALAAVGDDWDWFTYLNDDDALLPGFGEVVQRHRRRLQPESVAYGDVLLIDERGRTIAPITVEKNPSWIPALLQRGISPLMQQGMIFRRETVRWLGGFDLRYRLCADLDFWLRALARGTPLSLLSCRRGAISPSPGPIVRRHRRHGERAGRDRRPTFFPFRFRPGAAACVAGWRYRICNLPRYAARMRSRGFRTSLSTAPRGGQTVNEKPPLEIVILNDFASTNGGSTAVALASALGLAARDIPVTLFTCVGPVAPQLIGVPNLEVICLGQAEIAHNPNRAQAFAEGLRNRRAGRALRQVLQRKSPRTTLVHVHSWTKALSPHALDVVLCLGFRLVVTLHDYFIACPNGGFFVHPAAAEICRARVPLSLSCWTCHCDRRNFGQKLWRNARTVIQNRWLRLPERASFYVGVSDFSLGIMRPYLPGGDTRPGGAQSSSRPSTRVRPPSRATGRFFFIGPVRARERRPPLRRGRPGPRG